MIPSLVGKVVTHCSDAERALDLGVVSIHFWSASLEEHAYEGIGLGHGTATDQIEDEAMERSS
jgi:hypothetical protein